MQYSCFATWLSRSFRRPINRLEAISADSALVESVRMAATNTVGMVEETDVMVKVSKEVAEDVAVAVAVVVENDHKEEEDEEPVVEAAEAPLP